MSITLEDVSTLVKSILTIIAIPLAYIQTRKTNYDRAIALINEVSTVVLLRLYSNQFISKDEIKILIRTKALAKKVSSNAVLIDDILNKVVEKTEETPFISKQDRRRILEKIIKLKDNKTSYKLNFYVLLKNNEKEFISLIILIAVILYFFSLNIKTPFQSILQPFFYELILGLIVLMIIIILFYVINRLFNPIISQGSVKLLAETYSKLPSFYDEYLKLTNTVASESLQLSDTVFNENDNIVETDPGCLSFGIARFTKKHQSYSLTFVSEAKSKHTISLTYCIRTASVVNGSIDLDYIEYILTVMDSKPLIARFAFSRNESGAYFIENNVIPHIQKHFHTSYSDKNNVFVYKNGVYSLIINDQYSLVALEIDNITLDIL